MLISSFVQTTPEGIRLALRVQPRSSRNRIEGVVEDKLKVRLTAPPVENAANEACRVLLAEALDVSKGQVELVGGGKSRDKLFFVKGNPENLLKRLESILA